MSMDAAALFATWPGERHALLGLDLSGPKPIVFLSLGDTEERFALASVTKLISALGVLSVVDEGCCNLDDQIDDRGASLRMALAHATGYAPDSDQVMAEPGTRRIYSNYGYLAAASHVAAKLRTPFAEIVTHGVLEPLAMTATTSDGHPGYEAHATVGDLALMAHELVQPKILSVGSLEAMRSVQYPQLVGVLPGFGRMDPCPWGAGAEIKGAKTPHWSGDAFGPESFGHFGRAGGFVLIEPTRALGVVALGDVDFGPWAAQLWPALSDAVAAEA
jgi:hypothetical protein